MNDYNDYIIIALKRCIEVGCVTVSAQNVYFAIDIAENYFKNNNIVYDNIISHIITNY